MDGGLPDTREPMREWGETRKPPHGDGVGLLIACLEECYR